jgi:hypothetical protein
MEIEDCKSRSIEAASKSFQLHTPVVEQSTSLGFSALLSMKAAQLETCLGTEARRQELDKIEKAQKKRLSRLKKKAKG